ncbi:DUF1465 family protein [Novosphingobium sp. 9]|uniref:DUF1465 family protein n=1 Tax=Novosphingobium sp. 9 TaxID=2025349 RepID=UPI0021B548FA|nr:DUF1465 family protein [Novosphingobium sp. 9]
MTAPLTFNLRIIEGLYAEALILSDDVRRAFAGPAQRQPTWLQRFASGRDTQNRDERSRMALSTEGLRTTTRMMHAVAWLLNHRAFLSGEMSAFQLRRCGQLPPEKTETLPGEGSEEDAPDLPVSITALVERTRRFHRRIARLDQEWQRGAAPRPDLLEHLTARLEAQHAG